MKKMFKIFIIVFLSSILGIFSENSAESASGEVFDPWLNGFPYRKPITITGSTAGAQTYYQVEVPVSFVTGKMNSDFSDIRFTSSDGATLIDHWRESYTASSTADFWVEVPSIPVGGATIHSDNFDTKDTSFWTFDAGQTVPFNLGGNNVVKMWGAEPSWQSFYQNTYSITTGQEVYFEFQRTAISSWHMGALETSDGKRWCMQDNNGGSIIVQYNDGVEWVYPKTLITTAKTGIWYAGILRADDVNGFYMRVWEKDDPSVYGDYSYSMPTGQSWRFHSWQYQNIVGYIDNFEIRETTAATIYMYYGNPSASSASNVNNTFDFFDDFPGTSLDTSKWDTSGGVSVADSKLVLSSSEAEWVRSKQNFLSGNYRVDVKITSHHSWVRFVMGFYNDYYKFDDGGSSWWGFVVDRSKVNTWGYNVPANGLVGESSLIVDGKTRLETPTNSHEISQYSTNLDDVFLYTWECTLSIDRVLVRKYVSHEPGVSVDSEDVLITQSGSASSWTWKVPSIGEAVRSNSAASWTWKTFTNDGTGITVPRGSASSWEWGP